MTVNLGSPGAAEPRQSRKSADVVRVPWVKIICYWVDQPMPSDTDVLRIACDFRRSVKDAAQTMAGNRRNRGGCNTRCDRASAFDGRDGCPAPGRSPRRLAALPGADHAGNPRHAHGDPVFRTGHRTLWAGLASDWGQRVPYEDKDDPPWWGSVGWHGDGTVPAILAIPERTTAKNYGGRWRTSYGPDEWLDRVREIRAKLRYPRSAYNLVRLNG
jgi:hypothetical protein